MEELKNGMELLKEMRGVIGESVYATEVQNLLESFPVFKTFEKSVAKIDVIDLVDDDDDDHDSNRKPRLSTTRRSFETPRVSVDKDSDTSCTEEDLSNYKVPGINIPKLHWPVDGDDDDDDDVPPVVAVVPHPGTT